MGITENGDYPISVKYVTVDSQEIDLGQQIVNVDIDNDVIYDDFVYISSRVDILSTGDFIDIYDNEDYIDGAVSVHVEGNLILTKMISASDNKYGIYLTVKDLNLYNNIAVGKHKVKVIYMKNNVEEHVSERSVRFYAEPLFDDYYEISVGEKESIVVNYIKGSTGTVKLYNTEYGEGDWIKGTLIRSANFVDGVATIPLDSLTKGDYTFILNIAIDNHDINPIIDVHVRENAPGLSATVSASEITVGENVIVNFNGESDGRIYIYLEIKKLLLQLL